ncbi:MAG TPA: transposase, partial [Verrucomicrobiae bacterium]
GLYSKWVAECPLRYTSPNAPTLKDLLGTWVLASLSGAWRYAHVTALRGDRVNPQGLGMEKVVSEDSLRRAFSRSGGNRTGRLADRSVAAHVCPRLGTALDCGFGCDRQTDLRSSGRGATGI